AVVYTDDDPGRQLDDEVGGGQIALGLFLTDNFAIEGLFGTSSLSGADELDIREYGVNGLYSFAPESRFSPYLLVGFGVLDSESELFADDTAAFNQFGLGLDLGLGDGPLSLRLEHRRRNASGSLSPTDKITSLGLRFAFGGDDRPAPVVAAAPAPAPAPVQQPDSDLDGVIDADDRCPNTVRRAVVDNFGCELDDDKDGVVNRLDDCPTTTAGVRVDVKGCEIREVIDLPGVNFETNSDRLLPGADAVLREAAATLQKNPDLIVEVAGHTDSAGAANYNQGLSERRAFTVRDYLINAGAPENNLSARGYGEANPIADNATAEGRARNRRVELRIIE
ncbi:MAG: OmpA family protein, partial [Gammaproteobacteria bacterium]|nr:OmpA family protein [Gammaproteobacteria bacterium]